MFVRNIPDTKDRILGNSALLHHDARANVLSPRYAQQSHGLVLEPEIQFILEYLFYQYNVSSP